MKLSDKIIGLRKSKGWSQENLAEKLNVSRQAISRWEGSVAKPDAANIIQLSKLFGVSADYLLNDEYESNTDLPKFNEVKSNDLKKMILLVTLEVMFLIIQYIATIVLQSEFFGILSFLPFVAVLGGFEYGHCKRKNKSNEIAMTFRKRFYKISVWLGAYFPIRFVVTSLATLYPRSYNVIFLECIIFVIYMVTATCISLQIEKNHLKEK